MASRLPIASAPGIARGAAAAPRPLTATVERAGHALIIRPASSAPVLAPLAVRLHLLRPDGRGGCLLVRRAVPQVHEREIDYRPRLVCRAGLTSAVVHLLERAGYTVRLRARIRALPTPDAVAGRDRGLPVDHSVIDLIQHHDRGVIRFDARRVDPAKLIAQVALAYPTRKIAILSQSRHDVRRLAARLRHWLPGVRWTTRDSVYGRVSRVLVSTYWPANQAICRLWERHLIFALDPTELSRLIPGSVIAKTPRARLYGLLDSSRPLAPRDSDLITRFLGFAEANVPKHGYAERVVHVVFERVAGGPALPPDLAPVSLERRGIWHHPIRNRRIARVAAALAQGDVHALSKSDIAAEVVADAQTPRVAIFVDNVEHALALAQELPEWQVICDTVSTYIGLREHHYRELRGRRIGNSTHLSNLIVTRSAVAEAGIGDFDVVIRADAGTHFFADLARQFITDRPDRHPLLVIDFTDRHHPSLRRRSRARREDYGARGWTVDGVPPPTALERFLATRPEVSS